VSLFILGGGGVLGVGVVGFSWRFFRFRVLGLGVALFECVWGGGGWPRVWGGLSVFFASQWRAGGGGSGVRMEGPRGGGGVVGAGG